MEKKEEFLAMFEKHFKTFEWNKEEYDLATCVGNLTIKFNSGRDGMFLQVFRKGDCLGQSLDVKDYPQIKVWYNELWDMLCEKEKEKEWNWIVETFKKSL